MAETADPHEFFLGDGSVEVDGVRKTILHGEQTIREVALAGDVDFEIGRKITCFEVAQEQRSASFDIERPRVKKDNRLI